MRSLWQRHGANTAFYFCILAITVGLKKHYSLAGSDALNWILGPTAALAGFIGGISFEYEALTGYISRDARAVIAPACAGVNFMIMVFGMTAIQGVSQLAGTGRKLEWLLGTLVSAYLVTVLVNAVRITLSIHLYGTDLYGSHVTPAGLHRAAGIFIYLAALSAFFPTGGKIIALLRQPKKPRPVQAPSDSQVTIGYRCLIPLLWYLAFTLIVPLLRRHEIAGQPQFQNHVLSVISIGLLVFSIFLIGQLCYHHISARSPYPGLDHGDPK